MRQWVSVSLRLQLMGLITLALFPIGLISMYQTWGVFQDAREIQRSALVDRTRSVAAAERELIRQAFGSAEALAVAANTFSDARCSNLMERFVAKSDRFIFAGFVPTDGQVVCLSSGQDLDVSRLASFRLSMADPSPRVLVSAAGAATGRPVNIVSQPHYSLDGELLGFMTISIAHATMKKMLTDEEGLELYTINREGQIISSTQTVDDAQTFLPPDRSPASFFHTPNVGYEFTTAEGKTRFLVVTPQIADAYVVVGSWPASAINQQNILVAQFVPLVIPALMWLTGAAVAYFGLNRLVIRHIRDLSSAMRRFALGERRVEPLALRDPPEEFASVERAFNRMALVLTESEARAASALRDKEVLLKEVHHRVKNNLQLIASIMNMQMRTARGEEVRAVLGSLQRRVRGLAMLHRTLYTSTDMASVDAAQIIEKIITEISALQDARGLAIETDLQSFQMYPDQAVPLSMLISEAMTNVAKYARGQDGKQSEAAVSLKLDAASGTVTLRIDNSIAPPTSSEDGAHQNVDSGGLGTKLMAAFVGQLDGEAEVRQTPERYVYRVTFPLRGFEPDEADDRAESGAAADAA